ncbi:hypothetical protein [Frigoribacterium sp. RIT-PI-h]|uniref:hypothetical protein n=1 Tax=Frigoribacterium sp. RIT-PI-h TaxID=1690245 RepID=UPI0013792EAC|nr:hypothetical protein [Frigoribacterium sp. RIT-PI-h]
MPRWRKRMGVATILYTLGATLFITNMFNDLPEALSLVGVALIAIGLYFNIRAMAEMRR